MKNTSWRLLTREELIALYHNEMTRDFPPDERRPLATILALYDSGRYFPYGVFGDAVDATPPTATDDGSALPTQQTALLAYLNVVHASGCNIAFLDYFATSPAIRGGGLGGQLLSALCAQETARGATALLWEAETPAHAPDPAIAARRYAFYQRCGAKQTQLRARVYGVWFDILYRPCAGDLTPEEAEAEFLHTYHQLMSPEKFATEFLLEHIEG